MFIGKVATNCLKQVLPRPLLAGINQVRWLISSRKYRGLDCASIFSLVYSGRAWGGTGDKPCSGSGSEGPAADDYVTLVRKLIIDRNLSRIIDVGCGDFRIGMRLVNNLPVKYLGVDVVPAVVEYNQRAYGCERINFQCLDATMGKCRRETYV